MSRTNRTNSERLFVPGEFPVYAGTDDESGQDVLYLGERVDTPEILEYRLQLQTPEIYSGPEVVQEWLGNGFQVTEDAHSTHYGWGQEAEIEENFGRIHGSRSRISDEQNDAIDRFITSCLDEFRLYGYYDHLSLDNSPIVSPAAIDSDNLSGSESATAIDYRSNTNSDNLGMTGDNNRFNSDSSMSVGVGSFVSLTSSTCIDGRNHGDQGYFPRNEVQRSQTPLGDANPRNRSATSSSDFRNMLINRLVDEAGPNLGPFVESLFSTSNDNVWLQPIVRSDSDSGYASADEMSTSIIANNGSHESIVYNSLGEPSYSSANNFTQPSYPQSEHEQFSSIPQPVFPVAPIYGMDYSRTRFDIHQGVDGSKSPQPKYFEKREWDGLDSDASRLTPCSSNGSMKSEILDSHGSLDSLRGSLGKIFYISSSELLYQNDENKTNCLDSENKKVKKKVSGARGDMPRQNCANIEGSVEGNSNDLKNISLVEACFSVTKIFNIVRKIGSKTFRYGSSGSGYFINGRITSNLVNVKEPQKVRRVNGIQDIKSFIKNKEEMEIIFRCDYKSVIAYGELLWYVISRYVQKKTDMMATHSKMEEYNFAKINTEYGYNLIANCEVSDQDFFRHCLNGRDMIPFFVGAEGNVRTESMEKLKSVAENALNRRISGLDELGFLFPKTSAPGIIQISFGSSHSRIKKTCLLEKILFSINGNYLDQFHANKITVFAAKCSISVAKLADVTDEKAKLIGAVPIVHAELDEATGYRHVSMFTKPIKCKYLYIKINSSKKFQPSSLLLSKASSVNESDLVFISGLEGTSRMPLMFISGSFIPEEFI
ncbi:hypothetical protein AYI68_g7822 [Smittium mucronatum]|uniref:Uncharacterized protein n=1 Tax=Smittium mucronatum TaxID=133383 RepID=A0A1R0GML9_9FUNG|nr:hypothetical protein AYI68_g7822 [Smittium mucronatum]